MSKTQQKIQFARERGLHVRYYAFRYFTPGWYILDTRISKTLAPSEGPYLSKRSAKNDAYRMAVGQKPLHIGEKAS